MKMTHIWRYSAAALQLLCILLLWPRHCMAHPGGFWYGMHNTPGYAQNFAEMHSQYKMNWVSTGIMDPTTFQALKDNGLRAINAPYFYDNYTHLREDSSKVGWYSFSFFLHLDAGGDTVAWQWNPDAGAEHVIQTSGVRVVDTFALNSTAWCFDPAHGDTAGSIRFWNKEFTSDKPEEIFLRVRYRSVPGGGSGALAYLTLKKHETQVTLLSDTINLSEVSDTLYHEFALRVSNSNQVAPWQTDIIVEWAGTRKMWVDWFGFDSPRGQDVGAGRVDEVIKDFARVYGFGGDSALLGIYMAEELYSDGNVYPQKRIDSLIKEVYINVEGWTEHHYLEWWDSRHQYGGRNAASYRLQKEKHHTWISYPFSGYNPFHKRVTPAGIIVDTTKYVSGLSPCQEGPNTACLQRTLDKVGQEFRFFKRFADSMNAGPVPGAGFVPFLQAKASWLRANPPNCTDTAMPWFEETRPPTDNEVRAQASLALANGANGLLYYVYGSVGDYADPATITVPCDGDSAVITFNNVRQIGFIDLPGVQSALHNWVGPFVDSLGYFFADPDCHWKGGGRVDPHSDSTGLVTFFDSVKSLTLSAPDDSAYVEAGIYELAGYDYFFLANRRAYDAIPQTIRVWLNRNPGMYYIVDQYSQDTALIGSLSGSLAFTTIVNPGEGRLFKIIPLQSTQPGGTQLRAILFRGQPPPKTYRIKEVLGDGSLGDSTLTGALPDSQVPFTTTFVAGETKTFKIFPGPSSVSGSSFPSTWQGGIPVSGNITIAAGRTWNILPPATISVAAGQNVTLDVSGPLNAVGSCPDSIEFRSAAANGQANDWYGIRFLGAGNVDLECVHVHHAYKGIWISNTSYTNTVTMTNCLFSKHTMAGVAVDANPASSISVANSEFRDWGYYGVQIHQGKVDVQANTFEGGGLNAIRIDGAYQQVITGGHMIANNFNGLTNPNATGIYIYGVTDDGLGANEYLLSDNTMTDWNGGNQVGIQLVNCSRALRFFETSIHAANGHPGYGILNNSTNVLIRGNINAAESRSEIFGTVYGLYCWSGINGDLDHATVRQCSFYSHGSTQNQGYGVWVSPYGKVDLGQLNDPGQNEFHGNCQASPPFYTVYNTHSDSYNVPAEGNHWDCVATCLVMLDDEGALGTPAPCSGGSVRLNGPTLSANPFQCCGYSKLVVQPQVSSDSLPTESGALANYPNPFNSSTVLSFSLREEGRADVAVYNILGQKVRTVFHGPLAAGSHQIVWDGQDDRDRPVPSGVYFFSVTADGKRHSKSMIVLK